MEEKINQRLRCEMLEDATVLANRTDANCKRMCLEAIELMHALGLKPTPPIYEIFYSYVAHTDSTIAPIINKALSEGRPLDHAEVKILHDHYSRLSVPDEQLLSLSSRLNEGVSDASLVLEHAVETTANFCASLDGTQKDLTAPIDTNKLASVVAGLVAVTREMEREGSSVKRKLNEISCEVDVVKADLDKMRVQTFSDCLTETANRRMFEQVFSRAIAAAKQKEISLCLCMVDADHFKGFNDRHGHQAGDSALKLIASVLTRAVRDHDMVARYGGEEFAILLNGADLKTGLSVAERIRANLASKNLVKRGTGERLGALTVSIGIAELSDSDTPFSLLERADKCLYQAKNDGRNRVVSENEITAQPENAVTECATSA